MGTSSSSEGPGAGVPMVPPWADNPPNTDDGDKDQNQDGDNSQKPIPPSPIAPSSRFGGARTSMGEFAGTGSRADMRRGVGQYISKGYGGSQTAARRFGGTARTAASLTAALSGGVSGLSSKISYIDFKNLKGKGANEIMDAIVEVVRPIDGTQDTETARESVKEALCELLENQPDVDLLELDDEAQFFVVERFIAADIYRRIFLDLGKHIQNKSQNAVTGLKRLRQVKDYVRVTVKSAFNKLKESGENLANENIISISKQALLSTFEVFEGYA